MHSTVCGRGANTARGDDLARAILKHDPFTLSQVNPVANIPIYKLPSSYASLKGIEGLKVNSIGVARYSQAPRRAIFN